MKLVLEAVGILKGVKPIRMKDAQSGQMVDSYWEASKKMLQDEDFLPSLRYDGGAATAACGNFGSMFGSSCSCGQQHGAPVVQLKEGKLTAATVCKMGLLVC